MDRQPVPPQGLRRADRCELIEQPTGADEVAGLERQAGLSHLVPRRVVAGDRAWIAAAPLVEVVEGAAQITVPFRQAGESLPVAGTGQRVETGALRGRAHA